MRALVTGAGGFIGSALCRALVARGHEVHALTRDFERAQQRIGAGVRLFRGSVGDPRQIAEAAAGCAVLFHAAGLPPGPAPERVLRWLHVAGSENVLRAARHARIDRLVYLSNGRRCPSPATIACTGTSSAPCPSRRSACSRRPS